MDEALKGKRCAPGNQCLEGFSCIQGVCMLSNAGQGGAAVGQSGRGGASGLGGSGNVFGGNGNGGGLNVGGFGNGGSGGTSGRDGTGGVVSGGAAGEGGAGAQGGDDGEPDASAPIAGAGGCIPGPLYADLDLDGRGSGPPQSEGCPSEGLSAEDDDCLDAVPTDSNRAQLVYPGQTEHFHVGYPDISKPDNISFDYDCSGEEDSDPENDPPGEAPACEQLVGNDCAGRGWLPYDTRPTGNGIQALCGSEFVISCVLQNDSCVSDRSDALVDLFLCK